MGPWKHVALRLGSQRWLFLDRCGICSNELVQGVKNAIWCHAQLIVSAAEAQNFKTPVVVILDQYAVTTEKKLSILL